MTTPMPTDDPRGRSAPPPTPPPAPEAPDYLWDRSGPIDPTIDRLETLLAGSRLQRIDGPATGAQPRGARYGDGVLAGPGLFRASRLIPIAAVLAMLLGIGAWYIVTREPVSRDGWYVAEVGGNPLAGGRPLGSDRVLAVKTWLETDAASTARVKVPEIGSIDVSPNSRLRIQATGKSKHQVELDHGRIEATITAPERVFFVQTRGALAIDMGCRYNLEMPETGAGLLTVTLGWVILEGNSASSDGAPWSASVPRGASCVIDDVRGPGTPFRAGANELRETLTAYDQRGWDSLTDAELQQLLASLGTADGVTAWHLLRRVGEAQRVTVYERIRVLFMLPRSLDQDLILGLDEDEMAILWRRIAWG